ncbi:alpha-L-arabinofuranosidase C-terminal domain-containing protein [Caulobacter sp. BE254]|uniref:alpha-N-arabinofuranosidase n=1 Tax=Caulobacter sp. BE254 TaxID=2817720 RepID=UPI00285AEB05|nr:alpha-L-arabinofuranosidase C-terminal domain-containing protein [Caulobacter sp. BE254]MDR7114689.1 alpha-N-arabinofuranosidase [Caulobacter sp. BE254]
MTRLTRPLAAWAVALALGAPTLVQAQAKADPPITVRIDPGAQGPKIDRNIFGQFAEHLGTGVYGGVWVGKDSPIPNTRGIRKDVVEALRAIKVPNVRWPGGCFADEYHWRHGVGPAANRRETINSNWGGAVEPNTFGTDEFMDFVDQIGSEAYVSVNIGSGTVEEAAAWVEYMTADPQTTAGKERAANGHPAPYKVKYLGLGNESWSCGGAMRPDYYTDEMKRYARFVRNYNPKQTGAEAMQRIAVGPNQGDTAYTEAVMAAQKSHDWAWNIEGLSLHSYTTGGWPPSYSSTRFDETAYAKLLQETLGMDDLIAKHAAIMDKYDPDKKVPLVVDEWGVWLAPLEGSTPGFLAQQNSLRDAIVAALNLNIFARHADRVRMTNIAQMINVLQAMILTDKDKIVLTPTYHVYKMYLPFQDATLVPVSFDKGTYAQGDIKLPRIDATAVRDTQGKLWLSVTNLDPARAATIDLAGFKAASASGQLLTASRVDAINTFDAPNTVAPKPYSAKASAKGLMLEVPAKSILVVQLAPKV